VPRKNRFGLKLTELSWKSRASAKQSSQFSGNAHVFVVIVQQTKFPCCFLAAIGKWVGNYPKYVNHFLYLTILGLFLGQSRRPVALAAPRLSCAATLLS
jgi:hypothetical protein